MDKLAVYNEIDTYAAQWTRNLIQAGLVAPGIVDERSICDLSASDVDGPGQRHFFAGIGVWSHALRLAGVPDDIDVWTGSCPCQGLSDAGRKLGFADVRHLWPVWFGLIRECRPRVILGEQVASRLGLEWLDLVCADLEGAGYAVRAADTCAAGFGAPHIRQRIYFVAYTDSQRRQRINTQLRAGEARLDLLETSGCGVTSELGDPDGARARRDRRAVPGAEAAVARERPDDRRVSHEPDVPGPTNGFWRDSEWLPCTDGKSRPVEPGAFPLVTGTAARVGRLRATGNALCAPQAVAFIEANLDVILDADQRS